MPEEVSSRMVALDMSGDVPVPSFVHVVLHEHPYLRTADYDTRMDTLQRLWEGLSDERRQVFLADPLAGLEPAH